jgi:anti-sigma B factor antagonist/stage II sporulation protein AA (anti-sigma F factor antagonist)
MTNVEFSSRKLADVVVAAPVGQIDHPSAQELQQALAPIVEDAAARKAPLVLDFSSVEYISSMGLRVLMVAAKQMRSHNVPIVVAALQPVVAEIFEIARFKHVLQVFPSVRDALRELSASALAAYDASAT